MKMIVDLSIFKRNRDFSFLFAGQFISFTGTMMAGIALPYQIYMMTHSTLMVGLLSLVQLAPVIVTALYGGVLADRHHRKQLLIVSEIVMVFCGILLVYLASLKNFHLSYLFLTAGLMAAVNGLHRPALNSIVQQIVPKKDFVTVGALSSFKYSVGGIGGPAVGGIIIAHYGVLGAYWVDLASFAFSLVMLLMMSDIPKPLKSKKDMTTVGALKEGVQYAFSRQELVGSYSVDFIAMIFGMPTALFPAISQYYGGAKAFGMLAAAPAVGALLVSFLSGWANQIKKHGQAIAISAAIWGIAIIFFGLSSNFMLALFFLAIAGAADAVSGIFRLTLWNETIPQELRGRMAGIEMISYLSGPKLGDTEAGLVAAAFGVTVSVVSGGVFCVVGVLICSYYLPKFWHYKSKDEIEIVGG